MNVKRARTILAWVLVIGSCVGWPVSALTLAKHEPQFVLGLSWLAIILTALDLLTSSQVHEDQGSRSDGS
jgi:hypothetical protein